MKTYLLFLAVLFVGTSIHGQTTIWKSDPVHSNVRFTVTHLVVSEVEGRFKEFDVIITQTSEAFTDAVVEAAIKTASIDTDTERRDVHLKSDDFLNAEAYPAITFKSTKIEKTGENRYKVDGNLTIRNVTKPIVLDVESKGTMKDGHGNTKAGFKATATIDRFEFGTKWNAALETGNLVVGKDVNITIQLQVKKM